MLLLAALMVATVWPSKSFSFFFLTGTNGLCPNRHLLKGTVAKE